MRASAQFSTTLLSATFLLALAAVTLTACGSSAPPEAHPVKTEPGVIAFAPDADELNAVSIVTAKSSPLPVSADLNARLVVDEALTSRVGTPVAGRVTQLLADIAQPVRAGQVLATIDAPDLGQARADVLTAQAVSAQKAREVARSRVLFQGEAIARRELEAAEADSASAAAELERARLRLRNLGGGGGDRLALTSPIGGYVIDRQLNPGQQVSAGQGPLFTVSDPTRLWLLVDVPEDAAARAKVGEMIQFSVPAWPDRLFTARVTKVGLAVDPNTRRVQVRAELENKDLALKPEMYARARLVTDDGRTAIKVPNAAIVEVGIKSFVFRVERPGRFRRLPIEVGERGENFSFVTSGIKDGDRIVGEGALLLNAQMSGN